MTEIFLVCKILKIFPEEYFAFKSSWLLKSKCYRTVNNLTIQLCPLERTLSSNNGKDTEAFYVQRTETKLDKIKKQINKQDKEKCHCCGEVGNKVKGCSK